MTEEQAIGHVRQMRNEQHRMAEKIGELEAQLNEHRVVIDAVKKVEPTRRCYRLVGGVLVERTAGEVLPALETNRDGIDQTIAEIQKTLVTKSKELAEFMEARGLRFVSEEEAQAVALREQKEREKQKQPAASTGVLV
jgi:prefoldin subunit 2